MRCTSCGEENAAGAVFCGNCGAAVAAAPTAPIPPVPPGGPPIPPIPATPPTADPTLVGGMPPVPPPVPPTDPTMAFGTPPPGPPPMAEPPAKKKSKKALLFALLALLVVGALVGSFLAFGGDDDEASQQIVLEPIGLTIEDDFAGDLDLRSFDSSIANLLPNAPPLGSGIAAALSGLEAEGDTPGLYGGTRDAGTCDVEQLVSFLTDDENADKAEAWADALGIEVDDIEDFIGELTPLRLRFDTRVTNHGFVDGSANAFQSILEAGTAVLVDDEGVPRVKCNCGNPLGEPQDLGDADLDEDDALDEDLIQNPDVAWDGFDPENVVTVEPASDPIEKFILVDIDTGELFARPTGTDGDEDEDVDVDAVCTILGDSPTCLVLPPDDTTTTTGGDETTTTVILGTGDVQVTLEWFSNADLDLAVTDPNLDRLSFGNRGPNATGGQLDVDSNIGCPTDVDSGVENVFWPPGEAPAGPYTVEVNGFSVDSGDCGGGDYLLTIRVEGADDIEEEGSVADGETDTFTFSVG